MVLHPDAYLERKLVLPTGDEIRAPAPKVADFRRENIEIIEEVGPSMLVDEMILVSGEVARTTEFEKGFPIHYAKRHDHWEPDPLIMDDQCAIINVRDEGLVIITGCGHAGIINIIRNAQVITGIQEIYSWPRRCRVGKRMNARMGARLWLAHTQHQYAAMLLARGLAGDRARAMSLLDQVLATAGELGMQALVEKLQDSKGF